MGAFGAIPSFAFRRRGRSCVRMARMGVFKADEPDFWPDGDYSQGLRRFATSTRTAGVGFWHGRPCSRTTRVLAFRMSGCEAARWLENLRCVRLKRVAGACFATFIEQTFPSQVPGNHCFLLDSPSPSRIRRDMQPLGPSREGVCLCAYCAAAHMRRCACCAYAHAAQNRSCAHAHMRTMRICALSAQNTHPRIIHAEGALSAHMRIICAYALPRIICAHARVRILCVRIFCAHMPPPSFMPP